MPKWWYIVPPPLNVLERVKQTKLTHSYFLYGVPSSQSNIMIEIKILSRVFLVHLSSTSSINN